MNGMLYVYKSMRNKLDSWRSTAIFVLIVIMLTALFVSRTALSAAMILFVVVSFLHTDIKKHVLHFLSSPVLWGMSLLFFLPLVSGLWTEDKKEWMNMLRIKSPLLFLPLAFAGPIQFSKRQWAWLGYIFIALVTAGTLWSMFYYVPNAAAINESYLRAKTMITPLENDHVRFSWLASTAILIAGFIWVSIREKNKGVAWSLVIVIVWLVIFLHILAARTGLFSFYVIAAGVALWLAVKKLKWAYAIAVMTLLLALPLVAYKVFPTFQNRVKYFVHETGYFMKTNYWPGSNDAVRVISFKAGWNVMNEHPVTGVGFGDILAETKKWYDEHYIEMLGEDKIYPGSEWLMYGAGCGWPGLLLFTAVMIIPFFTRTSDKLPWWLLNITAAFSFLFDIGLEVQFGVFIYSFMILWWWKWLRT